MNEEKKPAPEIVLQGRFAKWLDNFWYHHKWAVIGIAVAVVILLVCILQTCSREEEDITLAYAGPTVLSISEMEQIGSVLENIMPGDLDENGDKHIAWMTYQIYSKEQIEALADKTDPQGNSIYVDRSYNSDQYSTYSNYLKTGETSVYLLDPWLYAELVGADRLMPLSEVLGEVPDSAIDAYGIRLGDTELYEEYGVLRLLPADTIVCLMRQHVVGKSGDDEIYRFECEMFRSLVTYSREES